MTEEELKFCQDYEVKLEAYKFLTIVKDTLTKKGLEHYRELEKEVDSNLQKYLTITGKEL